ncbi:MAG: D-tyrosyl-tRNA(Tyr) deacylase [Deltaproteobacteria bacterium]|nr:MAG: D-tyrosyl-tRNA(Tyr) deacylase [Deltaproteobacteria bacterium]
MRAVVQRVQRCQVKVEKEIVGEIDAGLLVLLGVGAKDQPPDADYLADKMVHLRIFEDTAGKMNRSLLDTGGQMLVVSQFTLLADCRRGRRPSFIHAAPPAIAEPLYHHLVSRVREKGVFVATGRFGAMMAVSLVNDGPVTLVIDSPAA